MNALRCQVQHAFCEDWFVVVPTKFAHVLQPACLQYDRKHWVYIICRGWTKYSIFMQVKTSHYTYEKFNHIMTFISKWHLPSCSGNRDVQMSKNFKKKECWVEVNYFMIHFHLFYSFFGLKTLLHQPYCVSNFTNILHKNGFKSHECNGLSYRSQIEGHSVITS